MRIIAGKYRSRRLIAPPGLDTRPTSDRLRGTLFNIIGDAAGGSVWLDLYAGSGAIGIEALSRGAQHVYFAEESAKAAAVILQNLQTLGITSGYELARDDGLHFLKNLQTRRVVCQFCFVDPPYRMNTEYGEALQRLSRSSVLNEASTVIAEHDKHFDPGADFQRLQRYRKLVQGDSALSFYRLATPLEEQATAAIPQR